VIHSGIYYKPGSMKARLARQGNESMAAFCRQHDIAQEICGKVIVASRREQLAALDHLRERGLQNGLEVQTLSRARSKSTSCSLRSWPARPEHWHC
jgi:L-2-hydroxyglutarate oxidase